MKQIITTSLTLIFFMLAGAVHAEEESQYRRYTTAAGDCKVNVGTNPCGCLCVGAWWNRYGGEPVITNGINIGSPPTLAHVKAEVAAGADPLGRTWVKSREYTPLHFAVRHVSPETVQYLIDLGADVNAQTKRYQFTSGKIAPIHRSLDRPENLRVLIAAGADINIMNAGGDTPLHWATFNIKRVESLNILLDAGAVATVKNKDGQTPFDLIKGDTAWIQEYATYKRLKAASGE